jgi:hypothetical protein
MYLKRTYLLIKSFQIWFGTRLLYSLGVIANDHTDEN